MAHPTFLIIHDYVLLSAPHTFLNKFITLNLAFVYLRLFVCLFVLATITSFNISLCLAVRNSLFNSKSLLLATCLLEPTASP